MPRGFFDANPAAALSFLQQQGAHIEPQVYRMEYPQYKYSQLVPLDSSAPDWAKTVIFQAVDVRGELQLLAPNSTDIPTVDIAMKQGFHEIKTAALGYTYSLEELEYAKLVGTNLDTERAMAVRDVTEQGLNKIYLQGNKNVGEGLFTSPLVSRESVAKTIATLISEIPTNGPQPIIDLFANAYNRVYVTNTNTVHKPTTFALPVTQMQLLQRTLLAAANGSNMTVLAFLKMNFPDMEFVDDINLKNAGLGGAIDRMMVYKKEMRVVKGHDTMPLRFLPPATADNINFKIPALVRTGGTEWRIPAAAHYVDNV